MKQCQEPPEVVHGGAHSGASWGIPATDARPESKHKGTPGKPKSSHILQSDWPVFIKNVQVMKDKKNGRTIPD